MRLLLGLDPVTRLPDGTLGNLTVTLSAWLHHGLGVTTSQIVDVFDTHLKLKTKDGGLTQLATSF